MHVGEFGVNSGTRSSNLYRSDTGHSEVEVNIMYIGPHFSAMWASNRVICMLHFYSIHLLYKIHILHI